VPRAAPVVFGMTLDAAGLVRLRLSKHAVHTWDVAVTIDPVAVLAPDAVPLLTPNLPRLAGWTGRAGDRPVRARLRAPAPTWIFCWTWRTG
jgi:hypothetical protein